MQGRAILLNDRTKQEYCLAVYIFCSDPWEDLLLNCVKPLAQQILNDKLANNYFFIRYWENGPHIRLRFFGDEQTLNNKVKPLLTEKLQAYLQANPTKREDPPGIETLPEKDRWFPNNTIQFIAYEPETDRYGGPKAIGPSELHFQDSSIAILELLEPVGEWSYERALGSAIQLHLSFAHATGMELKEAQEFFSFIFAGWLPRAYTNYGTEAKEILEERQEITLKAFKENFEAQQEFLIDYHTMLWDAFNEGEEFEEEWLNHWKIKITELSQFLQDLQGKGELQLSPDTHHLTSFETPYEKQQLWFIYGSYIHMTNNRLGIQNRDEAFLGYLIKECLGKLN